jgi:hypothetical protein
VPDGSVLQQGREKGSDVAVITDDVMREMRAKARSYSPMILRRPARYYEQEAGAVILEYGRPPAICAVADSLDRLIPV